MRKQDKVELSHQDREQLNKIIKAGQHPARVVNKAHLLLQSAANRTDADIAAALSLSKRTVIRVRQRFVEGGLELALFDKPRSGAPLKYDSKDQALIVATACTPPPIGRECWTIRVLTERVIELGVTGVSRETVRRSLKKTNCSPIASEVGA